MSHTHNTVPTQFVEADGVRFAYRRFGTPGKTPLLFTQHFMGNLDDFDPAITDPLSSDREIILFDNRGIGASDGEVPTTIEQMAADAVSFLTAIGLGRVDVLGHSMGGLVAQQIALDHPELVNKLILVGTGPRGGEEIGSRPAWVGELFTRTYPQQEDMWLPILFEPSHTSQAAGRAFVERILERPDRDTAVTQASVLAQRDAIAAYGDAANPEYPDLQKLRLPVLVVNGINDIIITTVNSYILAEHLPDARLLIYPDAGHGSHHQHHRSFVHHARYFLDEE